MVIIINKKTDKLTPKSYISANVYDKISCKKRKSKKISKDEFKIPLYEEYENIINFNYNVSQLKTIARFYKQKISGNKEQLINRLYNYLKYSHFATTIQSLIRGKLQRLFTTYKGSLLYKKRKKCVNDTDFMSLIEIDKIAEKELFVFQDTEGFVFGFDVKSFFSLIKLDKNPKNPYNRKIIENDTINNFKKYIKFSKILKKGIEIEIKEETTSLSIEQRISLKVKNIFQKIDEFGHITNPMWFSCLNREQLVHLLKNLIDIWDYRANLSTLIKRQICPPTGNPFYGINLQRLIINSNIQILKINILNIFENLLYKSNDPNNQSLGAFYILGALTITNQEAATSMPWLYDSFYITPEN